MAEVKLNVNETKLIITSPITLVSTGVNYDTCRFSFGPEWEGYTKTAVFYSDINTEPISMILSENDICTIPWESMDKPGILYIGVFGIKDNIEIPTNFVTLRLIQGAAGNNAPPPPSLSVYKQILDKVAEVKAVVESFNAAELKRKTNEEERQQSYLEFKGDIQSGTGLKNELKTSITTGVELDNKLKENISSGNTLDLNLKDDINLGDALDLKLKEDIATGNTLKTEIKKDIEEAAQVKAETEQLIEKGGAATKGDIQEVSAQLEQKTEKSETQKIQQQVNNLVLQAGNPDSSSAEIVQARGEYALLNDRLDAIDNTINTEKTNILKEIKDEFNPAKEEVEKSKVDYFGIEHNNLEERLNEDFDNIHQRVNESSLLSYEGANITASDSYYGLIKDLSIKGRTLQNLCLEGTFSGNQKTLYWQDINSNAEFIDNTVKLTANGSYVNAFLRKFDLLKPSTKYTIILNIVENTLDNSFNFLSDYPTTSTSVFEDAYYTVSGGTKGVMKILVTTKSELSGTISLRSFVSNKATSGYIRYNVMILEGDYTNTPSSELPFIEGIKSVGENEVTEDGKYRVKVKSCGKNLFDGRLELGAINSTTGLDQVSEKSTRNIGYIKVKPNTKYTISRDGKTDALALRFYDSNLNFISDMSASIVANSNKVVFDTKNSSWIRFVQWNVADVNMMIQLEEGTVATDYEPYKETVVEYLLDEPHMGLPNGVEDIIDEEGVLTKNIIKTTLNGGEYWEKLPAQSNDTTVLFQLAKESLIGVNNSLSCLCDNFPTGTANYVWTSTLTSEAIGVNKYGRIQIRVNISRIEGTEVDKFKTWLSNNNLTLFCQLSEPIETQLEPLSLKSFEGTTHIFSDNLLSPTISCKIPSNVPAIVSSLRLENEELQKENTALTEQVEENNIINIETSLEQDARLTMLELGVN